MRLGDFLTDGNAVASEHFVYLHEAAVVLTNSTTRATARMKATLRDTTSPTWFDLLQRGNENRGRRRQTDGFITITSAASLDELLTIGPNPIPLLKIKSGEIL